MSVNVINCKRCNRIFQRRRADVCPVCEKQQDAEATLIYEALHESADKGGLSVETLSEALGIPGDTIERYYMEGRFGTANLYLKFPCISCGTMTSEHQRRGRYCRVCSPITAHEAGVNVKPIQALREEERKHLKKTQEDVLPAAKKAISADSSSPTPRQFSFTLHSK